jgi:hypothetical protein
MYVRLMFGAGFIATSIGVWLNPHAYGRYTTSDWLLPTLVIVLVLISTSFRYIELKFSFY